MDPFGSGLHDLNKNVKIPPLADVTVLSSSVTVMILYETRLMVVYAAVVCIERVLFDVDPIIRFLPGMLARSLCNHQSR